MIENFKAIQSVLGEIKGAMENLLEKNETRTIFLNNSGLTEEEIVELLEALGKGNVSIDFKEGDHPVSWYETDYHGVWAGVYRNQQDAAFLYTIEIAYYPEVAGANAYDVAESINDIGELAEAATL